MKKTIITVAVAIAALSPHIAFAAEGQAEEQGSWLVLTFFAINFVLFAFLMKRFAVPMGRQFLVDRSATIRAGLSRAQSALAEAEQLAGKASAKIAAIEAETKALAAELDEETAFQVRRVGEAAASAAERIRRDAELTAGAISEAASRRVRERLAGTAANLAHDLISKQFRSDDQGRLLDGFMDQLGSEARR
ncbi:MAG TPA: hypothetical protein VMU16_11900 [Candidatus Binataceae bacterium]|nr:hypothetical protein [Candidatus Binataceae bacterium]